MIIYQLHETSGEYEDYIDRIVGSYIRLERAEEEKTRYEKNLLKKILNSRHCTGCPYAIMNLENEEMAKRMDAYCDHSKIYYDEDGELLCTNFIGWLDECNYYIEIVEVEE